MFKALVERSGGGEREEGGGSRNLKTQTCFDNIMRHLHFHWEFSFFNQHLGDLILLLLITAACGWWKI